MWNTLGDSIIYVKYVAKRRYELLNKHALKCSENAPKPTADGLAEEHEHCQGTKHLTHL